MVQKAPQKVPFVSRLEVWKIVGPTSQRQFWKVSFLAILRKRFWKNFKNTPYNTLFFLYHFLSSFFINFIIFFHHFFHFHQFHHHFIIFINSFHYFINFIIISSFSLIHFIISSISSSFYHVYETVLKKYLKYAI